MVKKTVFRMTSSTHRGLQKHFNLGRTDDEKFAFALCSKTVGPEEEIYLAKTVLLPGPKDMREQGPGGVAPSPEFQTIAYGLADECGLSIFDIHTHPFQRVPRFSCIDYCESRKNAEYIQGHTGPRTSMGMVVFNRDLSAFQGQVWERSRKRFKAIAHIEVLGRSFHIIGSNLPSPGKADAKFARHLRIPGWNQERLENLKVFLGGLGGNGASLFMGLLALGVGRKVG
jgi:hypothetical protein